MRLIPEWRKVLRKAWSVRFMILATLLGTLEAMLPFFSDALPRGVFAGLMVGASLAALAARLVAQDKSMGRKS